MATGPSTPRTAGREPNAADREPHAADREPDAAGHDRPAQPVPDGDPPARDVHLDDVHLGASDDELDARGNDRPASELDDVEDRQELHDRYYGLLQELRVLLPGVQILVAFLFTVPFASGFDQLDAAGRDLYGVALVSGILAVIAFTTPTVFHRVGARRSRSVRLQWGIRTTRAGLVLLAISLVAALVVVVRVVLDVPLAIAAVVVVVAALIGLWLVLPLVTSRRRAHRSVPGDDRD